jgi:hypothetical protein
MLAQWIDPIITGGFLIADLLMSDVRAIPPVHQLHSKSDAFVGE